MLDWFKDQGLYIILSPQQFESKMSIRNTGRRTENLLYNEKKQNVKDVDILF